MIRGTRACQVSRHLLLCFFCIRGCPGRYWIHLLDWRYSETWKEWEVFLSLLSCRSRSSSLQLIQKIFWWLTWINGKLRTRQGSIWRFASEMNGWVRVSIIGWSAWWIWVLVHFCLLQAGCRRRWRLYFQYASKIFPSYPKSLSYRSCIAGLILREWHQRLIGLAYWCHQSRRWWWCLVRLLVCSF